MKIVDVNVLVYASNTQARQHDEANDWLNAALSGGMPVGFAWAVLLGYVRITTNSRVMESPLTPSVAMDHVDSWLASRAAHVVEPTARHSALVRTLLGSTGVGANLVPDAHLAALSLEHKATVVTYDTDYTKFPGVDWELPRS